jgi:hypothetical protein
VSADVATSTRRRIGLFLAFCTLIVCGRVIYSSGYEFRQARGLEAEQRWHEAASGYGAAIRMYLPGLPVGARASDRLLVLADRATAAGEPDEARFCLEELRSGWLAVRSLWQPGQSFVTEGERRLAALILEDERGNWPDKSLSDVERKAIVNGVLAERGDPKTVWVLLMGLGYLLWLGGATMAIWRGIPGQPDSPVHWKIVGQWATTSVAGYLLWLLALANA